MAEACAAPRRELPAIFPGLVDQRELLHLDRPRRRPAGLEPAGRRAARAGRRGRRSTPAALARGARGDADRRRQRLVLVVRRRPFVGPRPRVRRPVPAPPAQRLPAAADSRFPTSCSSATSRPARRRRPQTAPTGAASRRRSTARRRATSSGSAPARSRSATSAGAMHQIDRRPPVVDAGASSGSTASACYVRVDGSRPMLGPAGRRASSSR